MVGMTRRLDQLKGSCHELPSIVVDTYEIVPPTPHIVHIPLPEVSFGAPFQLLG